MKKTAETQEEVMSEVIQKVGEMAGIGVDRDTIRFYALTRVSDTSWAGFDKVMFLGMIEEALNKIT